MPYVLKKNPQKIPERSEDQIQIIPFPPQFELHM